MKAWEEVAEPTIQTDTDAIVRVDAVTICGADLHILKGDVPAVTDGRILGLEAVGTVHAVGAVQAVGTSVKNVKVGDKVLVSCISARGSCRFCREGRYGQCLGGGGWILDGREGDGGSMWACHSDWGGQCCERVRPGRGQDRVGTAMYVELVPLAVVAVARRGLLAVGEGSPGDRTVGDVRAARNLAADGAAPTRCVGWADR